MLASNRVRSSVAYLRVVEPVTRPQSMSWPRAARIQRTQGSGQIISAHISHSSLQNSSCFILFFRIVILIFVCTKREKDSFHLLNTKFLMLSNYKTLQWRLLKTTGRDEEKTLLSLKTSVGKRTKVTDCAGKFWIPLYYVFGKSCFFSGLPNTEYFCPFSS